MGRLWFLLTDFFLGKSKYPPAKTIVIEAATPTTVSVGKGAMLK
jgi:hypothetical protein